MPIEEIKKFLPSTTEQFQLQGQNCEIKAFRLEDCIKLINDFVAIFEKVKDLAEKTKRDWKDVDIAELYELGFITKSIDNFKNLIAGCSNISMEATNDLEIKSLSKLVIEIVKINGIEEILSNFQLAGQLLQPELKQLAKK